MLNMQSISFNQTYLGQPYKPCVNLTSTEWMAAYCISVYMNSNNTGI